jgi:ABC-type Fe3+/spermidine/putrescine transport system ATPase subunit
MTPVATAAPPSQLKLDGVSVTYGRNTVLHEISLDVRQGEFVTLLGPSGCGKTSLLRVVSGFVTPSTGQVLLRDEDVTASPPHRRPVNMVFQRPTLFPHLDVAGNIAFGLRLAKLSKSEIDARVAESLELVRLSGFERRRSNELSGGQLQRVVMARALVKRPEVLLLDEPLSALDLKVRLQMEEELRRVHRESGATFLYVTHDQGEALSMSDRIVVLEAGRVEQIGAPNEIYQRPASSFVASFVGGANVLEVTVAEEAGERVARFADGTRAPAASAQLPPGPAHLVVRSEEVELAAGGELSGTVVDMAFRGKSIALVLAVPSAGIEVKADVPARIARGLAVGDPVVFGWDAEAGSLLPVDESVPAAR